MTKPMRAMLMPTYAWNPYLRLLAGALSGQGIETTVVSSWPQRLPILGAWRAQGRPDVVHLHWVHDFLGGSKGTPSRRNVLLFDWQLRILRARGVRIVWTVHNLKGHEAGADERDADAHRRLIERCDAIILHCEHARDALVEMYQPSAAARSRLHVVAHGGYVSHYAVDTPGAEARAALGLPAGGKVFAFVGAIRGYKNVGELLDAFSGLATLGPDARLLICGKPLPKKLGRELEQRAAADPRIILRLDRIPDEELSGILRAADVVVLPFRNILTSGSAILALSHGRPVIAPSMGCLPQTLPADASILYEPDATDGLSVALKIAAAANLEQMGERARAYADTLDWGPIAARTAELYR
ncbi:MAG: glycosyltransferase family 4 protein, partial [Chloroflexota bacterium]